MTKGDMKRLFLAALVASVGVTGAYAQSDETGPIATPDGTLQFTHGGHDFVATLNGSELDHFEANTLTHFDDLAETSDTVPRLLVLTESGPVLYDFRAKPPLVARSGRRMSVTRVFWQGEDVVMQGSQGWFRFKNGVLTKLQSTTTIYH